MGGRMSRNKGAGAEREFAALVSEALGRLIFLCEGQRPPSLRELCPHLHGGQGTSQTAAWFLLRYLTRDGLVQQSPGARGYTPSAAGRAALDEWQEAHDDHE